MIAAAQARGVYTALAEDHLLAALARRREAADLILAADVFIYVGALEEVFEAATAALRQGGLLAFSLEHHEGTGFRLHRQYRFAHAPGYVRALAARHGLTEKVFRRAALRLDAPDGWIVVLAKEGGR
jgi:predicted TPR repeat methyltransferase